jgi:hypothetical protein
MSLTVLGRGQKETRWRVASGFMRLEQGVSRLFKSGEEFLLVLVDTS